MKKTLKGLKEVEVEMDFTHSRAGLNTHRKNTAEQHRLENKIRSLDSMQRRSVQVHEDEQRDILQRLAASQGMVRTSVLSPKHGDGEFSFPAESFSTSSRTSRRGSLQPDPLDSFLRREPGSESSSTNVAAVSPSRRGTRPSVVLQNLSPHSPTNSSPRVSPKEEESDTIIDIIAAGNRPLKARRGSVGGFGDFLDRTKEERRRGEEVAEKGVAVVPPRRRRASLDVGVANLSLLSPKGPPPMSRLAVRRSSVASSQGTPSTPSTPDSKSRDGSSFPFPPPVHSNTSSPGRHPSDVRSQLLRRHSSDSLIQSSSGSHQIYVTPATPSQCRHKRISSLKLPRMQGRRKSVNPSVNRMVLLHNVLQNSASFKVADVEEGQL